MSSLELEGKAGGRINIRKINVGDITNVSSGNRECGISRMLRAPDLCRPIAGELLEICERERAPCEVLGEMTGDGKIVVYDPSDNTTAGLP